MELSQEQIIQKPNKQELSSFSMTHRLNVMHGPDTVYYMELSQEQIIIIKKNKQELSSFFTTHRLNVMHSPVKLHKYIPYG